MKKGFLLFGALALSCVMAVLITRRDKSPHTIKTSTVESLINIHGSPKTGFFVCGKKFPNPQGGPPYFLPIPGTSLIVFAYEKSEDDKTIVICDTNRCTFRELAAGRSVFGDKIGYWEASKGQWGDRIEAMSSNKIYVSSKGLGHSEKAVLDLDNNTVDITETLSDRNVIRID